MERTESKTRADGTLTKLSSANNVRVITGATTLTDADSGQVLILKATGGAAVTLPSSATVWNLKVIIGQAFASTAWTLVTAGGENKIQGGAIVNSTLVPAADEDTITFSASAETVGDYVELQSDGTNIYCNGVGTASGAIAFTAS